MKQLAKCRFIGRLGNNLFQLGTLIGYAKKYNVGWGIKKGYVEKGFNVKQVDRFMPHLPACDSYFKPYTEFQDKWAGYEFNYHEIPFFHNGVELVGFWQSYKYFENAEEEVREAINISYKEGYEDYCSIHIRRGDYVNLDTNFPPVSFSYIMQAISRLNQRSITNKYLVFSDDIEWCKQNLYDQSITVWDDKGVNAIPIRFEFYQGVNEWDDLCTMASCGHNIIANSSYSWWGAWLNKNPDKVVVSPSCKWGNWFGPDAGVKIDCVDLIPPTWEQIEFRTIDKDKYKDNPEHERQRWIDMNRVWSNPSSQTLIKIMK